MTEGRPVEKAETVLQDLIRRYGMESKLQESRLLQVWPQAVGPAIAAVARPVRMKNGVLWVQVKSSAWIQELSFQRHYILQRLASYLPNVHLHRLYLRTNWPEETPARGVQENPLDPPLPSLKELEKIALLPEEQAYIEAVASHLSDGEMRAAFQRAMTHEMQSRQWRIQHGWKPCPSCQALFFGEAENCPICQIKTGSPGPSANP
jgi:predicted nucleic acid-binding Zn ribbon protein